MEILLCNNEILITLTMLLFRLDDVNVVIENRLRFAVSACKLAYSFDDMENRGSLCL